MNGLKWFFMSGRKKLLYIILCAKANEQRLHLENGVTLDFTEDTEDTEDKENLLKERAGLKLHCAEYKRKYKALRKSLSEIYLYIESLKVPYGIMLRRRNETNNDVEREVLTALIKQNQSVREELQKIYDKAREVSE